MSTQAPPKRGGTCPYSLQRSGGTVDNSVRAKLSPLLDEDAADKRRFYYCEQHWVVRERPAKASDAQQIPHLVFESDGVVRRVRNFPVNWRDLSAAELYELSWHR